MGNCKKVLDKERNNNQTNNPNTTLQDYSLGQLLGVVNFYLDQNQGFKSAVERIAGMAIEPSKRAYAWTGLLTMDSQDYNRSVMYRCKSASDQCFLLLELSSDSGPSASNEDLVLFVLRYQIWPQKHADNKW